MDAIFIAVYLIMLAIASISGLILYLVESAGLYRLCIRRGLAHAWLSWVPFANFWVMGNIADDYEKQNEKKTNYRTIMLVLCIVLLVSVIILTGIITAFAVSAGGFGYDHENLALALGGMAAVGMLLYLVVAASSIALNVFMYISLYKLFKSTKPDLAVCFLLLSIFVPIAQSICVFICRNSGYDLQSRAKTDSVYTIEESSRL